MNIPEAFELSQDLGSCASNRSHSTGMYSKRITFKVYKL